MEAYSLYQLNEYIRRVIALNFREPLWIECEISQCKDSRGNVYLELIEKEEDGDDILAQVSAAIWYRNYKFIQKKHGDLVDDLLMEGTQVRLKCNVDFHERYGLKLLVQDIDPNFTFGKMELKRQEIINRLESEGLMELNQSLLIPDVIQKVAVISSAGAAGYQDFCQQLLHNEYGYTFQLDLYDCAVQGQNVTTDTTAAIAEILAGKINYDIITIIRGGGSKLDLSGYDSYEIAAAIAVSDKPFVIGIGHDIDTTVTDMVSCLSLKTPTAVADYIIDRNMTYESRLHQLSQALSQQVTSVMREEEMLLAQLEQRLTSGTQMVEADASVDLAVAEDLLASTVDRLLIEQTHLLDRMELLLDAKDPVKILQQGYAYLTLSKELVSSKKQIQKGDTVDIHLSDGHQQATIL